MFTIRKSADRGQTRIDWLDSKHTFSFGDYFDPKHHHFRTLRVINDDRIAGGGGFGTHPHRDMEIITGMFSGELVHRDSMGHGEVLHAGEWQAMTAGNGLLHSEANASATEPVHLLQIWIVPDRKGHTPQYAQKAFPPEARRGRWQLVALPDGTEGSLTIHQDARVSTANLAAGDVVKYDLAPGRGAYLQVATGSVIVNGHKLETGDGAAIEDESTIEVRGERAGEVVLFDLR